MDFEQVIYYSNYIRDFGSIAIPLICAAIIVQCHIPMVPFTIVAGICGFLFGFQQGILISWLSVVTGSFIAIHFYRFFKLDEFTAKILSKYISKPRFNDKFVLSFIVVVHNIPVIPIAIPNIVAAMSKISLPKFMVATAGGLLIPSVLFSGFGAGIDSFISNPGLLTFVPLIVIVAAIILIRFIKLDNSMTDTQ